MFEAMSGTRWTKVVLLATTALAWSGTAALARVGVTSATAGDPLGKPPSEAERVLRIGIDVQADELITTNASDRAHLVFIDGTSLTVGPNARLTIDKFVFDPKTNTGELAVTASKGVLRVVGGKISKNAPIVITTPANTVGIRGGITILNVEPNKTTSTFVFGKGMSVTALGHTTMVTRQGSQVLTTAGAAPGQPVIVPAGGVTAELRQLERGTASSSGGGSGSGTRRNADQLAQTSGFSSQNSGQAQSTGQASGGSPAQAVMNANIVSNALSNTAADLQQQQALADRSNRTSGSAPTGQVIVTRGRFVQEPSYTNFSNTTLGVTPVAANRQPLQPTGTLADGVATVTLADGRSISVPWRPGTGRYEVSITDPNLGRLTGTGFVSAAGDFFVFAMTDANNKTVGFAGGTPTSVAQFPTSGFAAHTLSNLSTPGGLPFASATVAGNALLKAAATVSPLYSVFGKDFYPVVGGPTLGTQRPHSFQATVAISGTGAGQISYIGVFIGDYFKDFNVNSTFNSGPFLASYRLAANQSISRLTSSESTFDTGTGDGASHSIYGPNAETMVFGQTSYRTSTTNSGGVVTGGTTSVSPQASFEQPFNKLSGNDYSTPTLATKTTAGPELSGPRTDGTLNGGFVGGIVESTNSTGAVTSTRTFGVQGALPNHVILLKEASTNSAFAQISVAQWNTGTSANYSLGSTGGGFLSTVAYVNDQIYAMRDRPVPDFTTGIASVTSGGKTSTGTDVSARTAIVSYGAAPVDNFFAAQGVTPCSCDFMTWGWWSGETRYSNNSVYNPNGRDRLNLATYVAGSVTQSVQMPTTGSATFTGHAVGNVVNGANSYLAAGTFNGAWNFSSRSGTVSISNFDGASYTGAVTQPNGVNAQFNGSIAGGGRSGAVNGAFFTGGGIPAKGMAGSFEVSGTNYKAGGTFAGQR